MTKIPYYTNDCILGYFKGKTGKQITTIYGEFMYSYWVNYEDGRPEKSDHMIQHKNGFINNYQAYFKLSNHEIMEHLVLENI